METFAALRLTLNSWRWQGVPFCIRAASACRSPPPKCWSRLRQPPSVYALPNQLPNHVRLRISPEVTIALGVNVLSPEDESVGLTTELVASRRPRAGEMDAYERIPGDAMHGDATLFAREDYVEEAWRIVDPVLRADTPVHEYLQGAWGPPEAQTMAPAGGWHNPAIDA